MCEECDVVCEVRCVIMRSVNVVCEVRCVRSVVCEVCGV